MGRKPTPKNYWTEKHEQLTTDYVHSLSKDERSRIYSRLRPAIRKIGDIILKRYFLSKQSHHLNSTEIKDLVSEFEINLIELGLPTYDPEKGAKAFSFIGTCARNFFSTYFSTKVRTGGRTTPLYDENGELIYDPIQPVVEKTDLTEIYDAGIERICQIIEQVEKEIAEIKLNYKEAKLVKEKKELYILNLIHKYLTENKRYSTYSLTYYLLKQTDYSSKSIYYYLYRRGLGGMVMGTKDVIPEFFENRYALTDKSVSFEDYLYYFNTETPASYIKRNINSNIEKHEKRQQKVKERNQIQEQEG